MQANEKCRCVLLRATVAIVFSVFFHSTTIASSGGNATLGSCIDEYFLAKKRDESLSIAPSDIVLLFSEVSKALGLSRQITLVPCRQLLDKTHFTGRVQAYPLREDLNYAPKGEYIIYHPTWVREVIGSDRTRLIALFGHELGHFINGHFSNLARKSRKEQEEEADRFAGCAVAALGGEWDALAELLGRIRTETEDPNYPDRLKSIKSAQAGFDECAKSRIRPARAGDSDIADLDTAFALLQRINKELPAADIGQSSAIRTIASTGRPLSGLKFIGMYLRGASIPGITFDRSDFSLAEIQEADLEGGKFTEARFDFVRGENVNLNGAKLRRSRHYFADYKNAKFSAADLSLSNMVYATLSGADLSNANFSNANLSFVDFSGANLAGADFTGAILNGAIFDEASGISEAVFADTSVTGTTGLKNLSLPVQATCGYDFGSDHIGVIQRTPSARFNSGYAFSDVLEYTNGTGSYETPSALVKIGHVHYLRRCPVKSDENTPRTTEFRNGTANGYHVVSFGNKLHFDRDILERRDFVSYFKKRVKLQHGTFSRALSSRSFLFPENPSEGNYYQQFEKLTRNTKKGMNFCLQSNSTTLLYLAAIEKNSPDLIDRFLPEMVLEAIIRSEKLEKQVKEANQRSDANLREEIVFPFGKLHLPQQSAANRVSAPYFALGPKALASARKWVNALSQNAKPSICLANVKTGFVDFSYMALRPARGEVRSGRERITGFRDADEIIAGMEPRPDNVSNVGFLHNYSMAAAIFFDKYPQLFESEPTEAARRRRGDQREIPIEDGLQKRVRIGISDIDINQNDRLITLRLRTLGEDSMPIYE